MFYKIVINYSEFHRRIRMIPLDFAIAFGYNGLWKLFCLSKATQRMQRRKTDAY